MANQQYLYLRTIGHKSGNAHEIEIWYVQEGDCYYLIAEHGEKAHWVQNIRANSAIKFRLGDQSFEGKGSFPSEAELIRSVKAKMDEKYNWSDGLIVQLCADD